MKHSELKKIERVESARAFARWVSNFGPQGGELIFRGQPCDEPLRPKLGRYGKRGLIELEQKLFDEFVRRSFALLRAEASSDWERLALAQHFGLPTRLLDWTSNAFAALWFAIRERDAPSPVVYALKVRDEDLVDVRIDPFENGQRTRIFRPRVITRRIAAQAGVFTVHRIEDDHFVPLERNRKYGDALFRITISAEHRRRIRQELNMFGANEESFFPDYAGVCDYLRWRHEFDAPVTPGSSLLPSRRS